MTFIQRFGYYLGGFSLGLVVLAFFFSGKKTSCAYSPNARVIKNIKNKERFYSEAVQQMFQNNTADSALVANIIAYGSVNFSESNTTLDSCKVYRIEASFKKKDYELTVENCEEKATVLSIKQ